MTILNVLTFPHPFLKREANLVNIFDEKLKKLANDMLETMYEEKGIGLAATQIGEDKRMLVMDVNYQNDEPNNQKEPLVFINPEIVSYEGVRLYEEGCLSIPEFRAEIKRHDKIEMDYFTVNQKRAHLEAEGLLSICIQHEIDHLNGILFIDHLPPLKRRMVRTKLKKLAKSHERVEI